MNAPVPPMRQYSLTAKWLHWLAAFFLLSVLVAAWQFAFVAPADRAGAIPPHASFGLIVVALTLLALGWRAAVPSPAPGNPFARPVHVAIYVMILIQATLGIWLAALSPSGIRAFGGFDLASLAPASPEAIAIIRPFHFAGACLLTILLTIHIAAALWHGLVRRDHVLTGMLPFGGLWQRLKAEATRNDWRFPSRTMQRWPKGRLS